MYSIQPSFVGGEVAPSLYARVDLSRYMISARTMKNMICHAHGGASNRAGTEFVAEVEDSSYIHRLIPFVFSVDQAYILEFGEYTMRIIYDGALVMNELVQSGVFKWTASGSGTNEYYLELDAGGDPDIVEPSIVYEDAVEMVIGSMGSLTAGQWDWGDNDTLGYDTVYVRLSDNTDPDSKADGYVDTPYKIVTVYPSADLEGIKYAQSADVIYIAHPDYYPQKVSRLGATDWTIEDIPMLDGPYAAREIADLSVFITPAERQGDDIAVTSNEDLFEAGHVGTHLRIGYPNPADTTKVQWGYGIIDQVTDARTARIDIQEKLGYEYLSNPEFEYGLAGWGDNSQGGGSVTLDTDTSHVVLTHSGATGHGQIRQYFTVGAHARVEVHLNIESITGGCDCRLLINESGSTLLEKEYSSAGLKTESFKSTLEDVWIFVRTSNAGDGNTVTLSEISITNKDFTTNEWRLAAWSSINGYPSTVAFFQQRLCFAGVPNYPQHVWKSRVGDYENFAYETPYADDDAFFYAIDSGKINTIEWMVPMTELVIGTAGAEWKAFSGEASDTLTPTSINVKPQSYYGCADISPIVIGNSVLYLQRGATIIRDLTYSLQADGYTGNDLSIMANHLFSLYSVAEWTYASLPDSIIWCIREDGALLGMTYMKEQEVWGWHRHETDGDFESVCSVPGGGEDGVYFIIEREIDGSTVRYIEKLHTRIVDEDVEMSFFVDSGLTLNSTPIDITGVTQADPVVITASAHGRSNGDLIDIRSIKGTTELNGNQYKAANVTASTIELTDPATGGNIDGTGYTAYISGGNVRQAVTAISGLDHLEGEALSIFANGGVVDSLTVSSGSITLSNAASIVHAGLGYVSDLETLDIEVPDDRGTVQGRTKTIPSVKIRFEKSRGAFVGPDEDHLDEIKFRDESDGELPIPLFTGDHGLSFPGGYDETGRVLIRQEDPIPLTVLAILPEVEVSER